MDTHAEFRFSERQTLLVRLGVIAVTFAVGVVTGISPLGVATLAVGFALYTALLQWVLLPHFKSDIWIYGLIAADMVFAGTVSAVFGLPGPAIAITVFFIAQHALFLGYRGAGISAALGVFATVTGSGLGGFDLQDAITTVVPVTAAVAAISGFIASDRFDQRSGRRLAEQSNIFDIRATRIVDGLKPIASANDESSALEAFGKSLMTVVGFDGVAIYTRSGGLGLQRRVLLPYEENDSAHQTSVEIDESIHGESSAARAASQGIPLTLGDTEPMPKWATEMGYSTGVVAPIMVSHLTVGVVFGFRNDDTAPSLELIDQTEGFVSLSARFVAAHNSGTQLARRNRLSLELDAAGRTNIGEARPIIKLDGLTLDPATDRSSVVGTPVALSRSEFNLLYALASSPGQIVDPGSLIKSTFGESPDSSQRNVDSTIYRLRRKLSRAPSGEDLIKTVRGKGYLLVPPANEKSAEEVFAGAD